MALTLTDLQTYSGTTYPNAVKAQAKLDQTISRVSSYLCFPVGVYGFSDKGDSRSDNTFDGIVVNAFPELGTTSGKITIEKTTNKNDTITVLINGVGQAVTTTGFEATGLATGNHTVEYGNYVWDINITPNDVSILPKDKTTSQYWHIYNYNNVDNIFLEPVNDVYQAVFIDCEDKIIEDVDSWTFHGNTLRVCKPSGSCSCKQGKIRLAVLGDWYIPQDIETVIFDLADAVAGTASSALAGTLKKETIGSYSYEKFGDAVAGSTDFDAQVQHLKPYRICKDII